MDNKIDLLLEQIGSEIPKVNPNLSSKIYQTAVNRESKKIIPFFKKPFIIAFTSIILFVVTLFGTINLGKTIVSNGIFDGSIFDNIMNDNPSKPNTDNPNSSFEGYAPNLSPNTQNTVFIEHYYSIYTKEFDVVTIIINNKINYQKVYIKAYNLNIEDIKVNNGEVTIKKVNVDDELFFELAFDNTYTNIHYLDICFKKDAIKNILSFTERFELGFIMYINEINKNKGYGYDFQVSDVIDLREGNSL